MSVIIFTVWLHRKPFSGYTLHIYSGNESATSWGTDRESNLGGACMNLVCDKNLCISLNIFTNE